jgi:Protein of unknown function (DUF3429)
MTRVPLPALAVGWLGLVPFGYAVLMIFSDAGTWPTFGFFASDAGGGLLILERFGAAILGFMGGCLWGFAGGGGRIPTFALLAASAVPAILAALAIRPSPALSCIWLAFGFVVVQAIDVAFHRAGVAPAYWLTLRLPLTAAVMACLLAGALHG